MNTARRLLLLLALAFAAPAAAVDVITLTVEGTLGNVEGAGTDGVLVGTIAAANPATGLLQSHAVAGLCYTDDGGVYVDETTPFGEATADDVEVIPATPADDDATYFGHATYTFARLDVNLTTQGVGTWTLDWEYWNGTAWTALSGVTDGTTAWEATTGWKTVSFTLPGDWAKNTVDSVLAYWIRAVVDDYSAVTTAPQVGQGYVILASADSTYTTDTTDLTDAGAGDVALLPTYPVLNDAFYYGSAAKYTKLKVEYSQERTGTATLTWEFWDGDSWESISVTDDDTAGYSTTAGTLYLHFQPPATWTANTAGNGPNGQTGFFVRSRLSAITDVTQQPLGSQAWVLPLVTGAQGVIMPASATITKVEMNAGTASATNTDSVFLLINVTQGTFDDVTWTAGDVFDTDTVSLTVAANDQVVLVQIKEDGTTEFATGASFYLTYG